jgi:MFS family permease
MIEPPSPPSRSRFYYGWIVVISGSVAAATITTLLFSFGVFLVPISESTGWSRGQISLANMINYIVGAFAALGIGWMVDRFGSRRTMLLGGLLVIASQILTGKATSLFQFYLFYGFIWGISRGAFLAPVHVAVGLWFKKRLGMALGFVNVSLAAGPFLFFPLIRYLITRVGWANAFIWMGVIGGVILFAGIWVFRNRPSDMGLKAYGDEPSASTAGTPAAQRQALFYKADEPNFFRYAMKTQPFVLLILVHFFGCVSHNIPLVHVVAMAQDKGITPMAATSVLSLMAGFSIASRFGISVLADMWDGRKAAALACFGQAVGVLLLLPAQELWQFYLFTFIFGLGYGGEMVVFPVLNRQYYGMAPIGTIYATQLLGAGLGMALGGYAGGLLYDLMGNYTGAIWLSFAAGILGTIAALRMVPPFPKARQTQT